MPLVSRPALRSMDEYILHSPARQHMVHDSHKLLPSWDTAKNYAQPWRFYGQLEYTIIPNIIKISGKRGALY
jgi:hypothetical protein